MPGNPRIYARLYASCWTDERTATLTIAAFGLWSKALVMCKDKETDGVFAAVMVSMMTVRETPEQRDAAVAELIDSGLWVRDGANIRVPNWGKYQSTNEQIEQIREQKRKAGKRGAEARYGTSNGDTDSTDLAPAMAHAMAHAKQTSSTDIAKIQDPRLKVEVPSIQNLIEKSVIQSSPTRAPTPNGKPQPTPTADYGISPKGLDGSDGYDPRRMMRAITLLEPLNIDKRNRAKALDMIRQIAATGGDPCAVLARVTAEVAGKRVASPGGYAYRAIKAEWEKMCEQTPPVLSGGQGGR